MMGVIWGSHMVSPFFCEFPYHSVAATLRLFHPSCRQRGVALYLLLR